MRRTHGRPVPIPHAAGVACLLLALALVATPAAAVRVCTYNILNVPGSDRVDDFRLALEDVDADVLVVQEILSQTAYKNDIFVVANTLFGLTVNLVLFVF